MLRFSAVVGLFLLLAGTPDRAEGRQLSPSATPNVRSPDGWVEVAAGSGWSGLSCGACRSTLRQGPEVRVGAGRALSPTLRFGAEIGGWTSWGEQVRDLVGHVHLVGHARPENRRLALRGGVGVGHYRALNPADGDDIRATGLGFQLGVDTALSLGERFVLSPQAGFSIAGFGKLRRGESTVANRVSFRVLRLGASLSRR